MYSSYDDTIYNNSVYYQISKDDINIDDYNLELLKELYDYNMDFISSSYNLNDNNCDDDAYYIYESGNCIIN